jgi:hypothetical protein
MGSFVNGNLMKDERVGYDFHWHWIIYLPSILLIPLYGIGLVMLMIKMIEVRTTELSITDRRILGKTGLIYRQTYDFPLDTITAVSVDQGIIGRLLNYGYIRFKNDGQFIKVPLPVGTPVIVRNMLAETQQAYKSKLFGGKFNVES